LRKGKQLKLPPGSREFAWTNLIELLLKKMKNNDKIFLEKILC